MRLKFIYWAGFFLVTLAYLLPWAANEASGLTMGTYDLAEWLSKSSMYDSRIYNTVLALRGQLFLLTILLAIAAKKPFFTLDWYARAVLGLALVIAQLPALNMLPSIGVDINRQQQVILALLSFVALLIGLSGIVSRWSFWIGLSVMLLGLGTSVYGLINALDVMRVFALSSHWGNGFILYILALLAFSLNTRAFFNNNNSS